MFDPIDVQSLRSRIAERIREAILNGDLSEGQRLVERRLAQEFASSLTAVREALIELESDGFIEKLPNSSTHVIKLSQEDAGKITSVREVLEGYAVTELVAKLDARHEETLVQLVHEQMDAAAAGDARRCLQKDLALHETLWKLAGNQPLESSLRRVVLPFYAFLSIRMRTVDAAGLLECAEANLPLLAALGARDSEGARQAMGFAVRKWLLKARSAPVPLGRNAKAIRPAALPESATA